MPPSTSPYRRRSAVSSMYAFPPVQFLASLLPGVPEWPSLPLTNPIWNGLTPTRSCWRSPSASPPRRCPPHLAGGSGGGAGDLLERLGSDDLKARERVIGRHRRARLRRALALEHLRQRLPQRPAPGVGLVDLPAVAIARVEHLAVAEVRIVGDRHRVARAPGGGLQPLPQLLGMAGLVVAQRQVRDVVAAEDDDPVEVDPARGGRPLKPVQRREPAGLVVALRDLHDPPPDRPARLQHFLLRRPDIEPGGIGTDHPGDDHLHHVMDISGPAVVAGDLRRAVALHSLLGPGLLRVVVRVHDEPVLAQPLGVLGDRREVQRARQPVLSSALFSDERAGSPLA